ncbi:MAG: DUF3810 domain-containing protein [Bacteroidales bacterium]
MTIPYKKQFFILGLSVLMIFLFRAIPAWNSFYAQTFYPLTARILNRISSLVPFSIYDIFILIAVTALITGIITLFLKTYRKRAFFALLVGLGWIYVAFYVLWGINYFAPDFSTRNELRQESFDPVQFGDFLDDYVKQLNGSYTPVQIHTSAQTDSLIHEAYQKIKDTYLFPALPASGHSKKMLFGKLYAAMGIRGYYGPFFAEAHINPLFLPHEQAAVQAHELGHLAGITSEAEANLFAYLVTTASSDSAFRFSGYYSILPYVLQNARTNLSESDFRQFVANIDPQIRDLYTQSRQHWRNLYSDRLGAVQDWFYEAYLKGNNIPSGTANYSEVIGLLIATRRKYNENL